MFASGPRRFRPATRVVRTGTTRTIEPGSIVRVVRCGASFALADLAEGGASLIHSPAWVHGPRLHGVIRGARGADDKFVQLMGRKSTTYRVVALFGRLPTGVLCRNFIVYSGAWDFAPHKLNELF